MINKLTELIINKIKEFQTEISRLELTINKFKSIANELDKLKKGEFIALEYEDEYPPLYPLYLGNYQGVVSDDGEILRIKLSNFAFVMEEDNKYKLCDGKMLEELEKIATKLIYGKKVPTNIYYPPIHSYPNIIKGPEIEKVLEKYGYSIADYNALFK